jgi:hypothetical protein
MYASIFAQDARDAELFIHEIQESRSYRDTLKLLQSLSPDDPNTDLVIDSLAADFLEKNSFVSLDLLRKSGLLSKVRKNEQLQTKLVFHLMKIGDTFDHPAEWTEIDSYLRSLLPGQSVFLFLDALGNPIPKAEVQVFPHKGRDRKELITKVSLDEYGLLKIPRLSAHSFVLSHPDYGIASIGKDVLKRPVIWVPLVRSGSDAEKCAIKGVVVDEANSPIPGVQISCMSITTPGGGKITWHDWWGTVLSDQHGRFRMCMSVLNLEDGPERIPPGSKYDVGARLPSEFLNPSRGWDIPCGRKSAIKLERPEIYFRTFVFEDANGPITDPNRLGSLLLYIKPSGMNEFRFGYADFNDGGEFPAGRYRALVNEHGKDLWFETIEVTKDSPEQLVLKPKVDKAITNTLYIGRAMYGFTNLPAQGAFVVATTSTKNIFAAAMITDEQWSNLHRLGTAPSLDEPALEPLHGIWEFDKILRTDSDGRFQITTPRGTPYRLFVIEKSYVPVYHWTNYFRNDPNECIELPVSRLLLAAKISFSATLVPEGKKEVYVAWDMAGQEPTDWTNAWSAYISIRPVSFPLHSRIQSNRAYTLCVPVGPTQRLSFKVYEKGEYWTPVYTDNFRPEQGQTLDLGEIDLTPRMPIYVQVVDSSGKPLEGIAVNHCRVCKEHNHYFGQKHITDADGIAEFFVPPHYKGRFSIGYHDSNKNYVSEWVGYETNGPEDANIIYTLQISDEIIYHLFKRGKEQL